MLLLLSGPLRILGGKQISESAKRHPARDGSPQERPPGNGVLKPMSFVNPMVSHKLSKVGVLVLPITQAVRPAGRAG
jgi:hypothetical protein